ncbi:phosphate butyryltransferase [Virgibacillus necropolis]|uniref:Phosphate butyryltransferase n=1 Tax=Virgibacillus necropolis TaxID=163877 RepID=A0A221MCI8_9BACI|nr:phosphate butyryltransferase [Virgibacillus necropolis]ASN05320.1 phosphate butyryltransferase [Virgibacillus necropolis]
MNTLDELKKMAKNDNEHTVSVANAADAQVLKAVRDAVKEELCAFILFGNKDSIQSLSGKIGLDLSSPKITVVSEDSNPASAAVKAVHDKEADILMKGNVSTKDLLKSVLNKEYGLRSGKVLSHVALFEIPNQDRLLFLTDAGMNIAPTLMEKVEIINNAVKIAQAIGIDCPKVAALAAVEVVNPAMQATVDAAMLTQMQNRNQIHNCIIDGPLAFDNAVSKQAAEHKNIQSKVAGLTDIIAVPTIEVGNALYKSFMYFANAKVAAVVSGASAPIVLTSRADSAESKLYSLSLALVSSKKF